MDISQGIELTELLDLFGELSNLIFYVFSGCFKLFFNDIRIFSVPIGYLILAMLLIGALGNVLVQRIAQDD